MQQATVNLFADMGVQPLTLQSGLFAATDVDRYSRRPRRRSRRPPTAARARELHHHHHRHGRRHRRRPVAASRCRSTAARPGAGPPDATAGPTPGRPARRERSRIRSRAADDSGNIETPRRRHDRDRRQRCRHLPVLASGRRPESDRSGAERGRDRRRTRARKFRSDMAGFITGDPLLQEHAEYGHARRQPLDAHRDAPRQRHASPTRPRPAGRRRYSPSPVAITANTTYVVSYHTDSGFYVGDDGYLPRAGVDNGPLHAPRDGDVRRRTASTVTARARFPNSTYNSENYWVDVVFTTVDRARTRRRRWSARVTPVDRRLRRPPRTRR